MQADEKTLAENYFNFIYHEREERIKDEMKKEEEKKNEKIKEEGKEKEKEEEKTEEEEEEKTEEEKTEEEKTEEEKTEEEKTEEEKTEEEKPGEEKTEEEKAEEERIAAEEAEKAEEKYRKRLRSTVETVIHNIRFRNCLMKYVKVKTASSSIFEGWFKCIDPLGGTMVFVQVDENFSKIDKYFFIYEYIKEMEVVKEGDERIYKLFNQPLPQSNLYLNDKKRLLILWMQKHKLPAVDSNDGFSVMIGSKIKVSYPYDFTDVKGLSGVRKQLLKRVKYLVKTMPDTEEEVNQYELKPATDIVQKRNKTEL